MAIFDRMPSGDPAMDIGWETKIKFDHNPSQV